MCGCASCSSACVCGSAKLRHAPAHAACRLTVCALLCIADALPPAAQGYHVFLASDSVIKQIPRLLGPGLNKAGKFPAPINKSLEEMVGWLGGGGQQGSRPCSFGGRGTRLRTSTAQGRRMLLHCISGN